MPITYKILATKTLADTWDYELIKFFPSENISSNTPSFFNPNSFTGMLTHYDLKGEKTEFNAYDSGNLVETINKNDGNRGITGRLSFSDIKNVRAPGMLTFKDYQNDYNVEHHYGSYMPVRTEHYIDTYYIWTSENPTTGKIDYIGYKVISKLQYVSHEYTYVPNNHQANNQQFNVFFEHQAVNSSGGGFPPNFFKNLEDDKIINNLTNDCASTIFEELKKGINPLDSKIIIPGEDKTLNFSEEILKLFDNSNETHYTVQNNNTISTLASTNSETNITTFSDSYLKKGTRLSIARTMIHEQVHAYLNIIFYGKEDFKDKDLQYKLRKFASQNTSLDYEEFHHEFMGNYVNAMAYSLYEWDKRYGSGKGKIINNKPKDLLGWDYYYAMAFGGLYHKNSDGSLTETNSLKKLVPNENKREEIKQILVNEQGGLDKAKSDRCNDK